MGMLCASRTAERLGMVDAAVTERQRRLLQALGLPTRVKGVDPADAVAAMSRDKKTMGGRLRPVLPHAIGRVEQLEGVDAALVQQVLAEDGFLES